jgi:hypothetical protein
MIHSRARPAGNSNLGARWFIERGGQYMTPKRATRLFEAL